MNKIKDADFMTKFPPALKKDKSMSALGQLIAEELHITANETKKNIIYANIDELSETWLDVLAYDLHVDWYDYDYPVETKRKIIKNSIRVHQKLGTKYAVETVLKDVYRTAKVEEWFEYGGEPYTFRIKIDIGNNGLTEDTSREIERNMQFYKNLRSHCSGIYYRLGAEKADVKAVALHKLGGNVKVKPYIVESIKTEAEKRVVGVGTIGGLLKIKPALQENIEARAREATVAYSKALNTLKVKPYLQKELKADTGAVESLRAYSRNRHTMTIRKEQ